MDQLQQYSSVAVWPTFSLKKKKKERKIFKAEVILAHRRGPLYLHFHHSLLYTQVLP